MRALGFMTMYSVLLLGAQSTAKLRAFPVPASTEHKLLHFLEELNQASWNGQPKQTGSSHDKCSALDSMGGGFT